MSSQPASPAAVQLCTE